MGNTCSLCISSNKIHPIQYKKKSKTFSFKKYKKNSFKKKTKKSKKSKYVIIPQQSINNIYSKTQI